MTLAWWGLMLGACLGLGLAMIAASVSLSRRPSLDRRVLPYVRDVPLVDSEWRLAAAERAGNALATVFQPFVVRNAGRLERLMGGRTSIQRRLVRLGSAMTVEQFRISQVCWAMAAIGATLVVGLLGPARSPGRALPWLAITLGAGLLAILLRDALLSRRVRQREAQMLAEFPLVADLMAIAVAAGEGPVGALDRVVSTCRGPLPTELGRVLAESRTGVPIARALDAFASRTALPIGSRFAEGLAIAIDRGTPLVDVLTAQAGDVREASKRTLIEAGARKEVGKW